MARKKYRALTGLLFPAMPAAVKKKEAGEELGPDAWKMIEPGEITDAIPPGSAKCLLADGLIEEVRNG